MNARLVAFLLVLTAIRLVFIGRVELSPDEAYYHEWSQRLDWCYFSKGPGIALAMRASTAIFGHGEFGIRAFAPLLALGSSVLLFWLARRIYDVRTAVWTVVAVNVAPIFNVGGLVMTIDPLSIFFWIAALCTLWRALENSPAFSLWWPLSGVIIGCGFLCKWTNAMELLSVLLLLAMTPRYRRELFRPGFLSMIAVFVPFVVPVWQWNETHGWPTTHHLAARGGLDAPWWRLDFKSFGAFLGSHFGVYSPLIFVAMLVALWVAVRESLRRWAAAVVRALRSAPMGFRRHPVAVLLVAAVALTLYFVGNYTDVAALQRCAIAAVVLAGVVGIGRCKDAANIHWRSRFLIAFALPLIAGYTWIALHHDAEVNWTAPAAVTVIILAAEHWKDRSRLLTVSAFVLGAVISIAGINPDIARAAGIPWPLKNDPTARVRGWRDTAKIVHDYRQRVEAQIGRPVFLIAENYGVAAALCYYLPEKRVEGEGHPPVYVEESPVPMNQFHFWPRYDEYETRTAPIINDQEDSKEYGQNKFAGRPALYITTRAEREPASVLIPAFFQKTLPDKNWKEQPEKPWRDYSEFELRENGEILRKLRIFILPRYKPGTVLD